MVFELWRMDDNGNRFLVDRFEERSAAEARMAELAGSHHKQTFWITEGVVTGQGEEHRCTVQGIYPLRVYYDGSCSVCAREIGHYLALDREGRLEPVDISSPGFDPAVAGIPLEELFRELHVIDRAGTVYRGVDSFRAIWQAFPGSPLFRMLVMLVALPVITPVARLCYKAFARIRRFLPRRGADCRSGSCRIR